MSQTTTLTPPRHALVQVTDARGRVGSLHAARLLPTLDLAAPGRLRDAPVVLLWRTACGVDYIPGETRAVEVWERQAALDVLAANPTRHCSRCTRVGDAVDAPE